MTSESSLLTSTQKGAIAENMVANQLILESDGQLSPFAPVADDDGIDMLVYDKITGKAVPLQIKSRTKTIKKSPKVVHFEVRKATLKQDKRGYVLAVLLSEDIKSVRRAWLIPMGDIPRLAKETATKYVLRPSKDMASRDKYTGHRCENINAVVQGLKAALA